MTQRELVQKAILIRFSSQAQAARASDLMAWYPLARGEVRVPFSAGPFFFADVLRAFAHAKFDQALLECTFEISSVL